MASDAHDDQNELEILEQQLAENQQKRFEHARAIDRLFVVVYYIRDHERDALSDFKTLAKTYSRAWCKHTSEHMFSKLPRELRNMVYESLLESPYLPFDIRNPCLVISAFHEVNVQTTLEKRLFYGALESFVGTPFAEEYLELAYSTVPFRLNEPFLVREFLNADVYVMGVIARDHVRHLSVVMDFSCMNDSNVPGMYWAHTLEGVRFAKNISALSAIRAVGSSRTFQLRLVFNTLWPINELESMEKMMVPLVYSLTKAGINVMVADVQLPRPSETGSTHFHFNFERPIEEWLTILTKADFPDGLSDNDDWNLDDLPDGPSDNNHRTLHDLFMDIITAD